MLESLEIENLRGIRRLRVDGLGRFNLVVGGNDVGKSTLLAAIGLAQPQDWFFLAPLLADPRPEARGAESFEDYWRSMFHGVDVSVPIRVARGQRASKGAVLEGWVVEGASDSKVWPARFLPVGGGDPVVLNPTKDELAPSRLWWSPAFVEAERDLHGELVALYKSGRVQNVVPPLHVLNEDIERVEPVGDRIYVRLRGHALPLPYGVLGDGARRMLEFAVAVAIVAGGGCILIDELENGFHHRSLSRVVELLRCAPDDVQVAATTHREELIRVACEQFLQAGDDGLRIVRLDRRGGEHVAVTYTAQEALDAMDMGLEIRG